MKCASLKLQQRTLTSSKPRSTTATSDQPRHYCQQRLVNPGLDEDPRWIDVLKRFHCHLSDSGENASSSEIYSKCILREADAYLTVQNLKFCGNQQLRRRPRRSFKYKNLTDGRKHRMFVKQVVEGGDTDDDQDSKLTCYYLKDYSRYIASPTRSRPSSGRSPQRNTKEHKAVQTELPKDGKNKQLRKQQHKSKGVLDNWNVDNDSKIDTKDCTMLEDTQVSFHKYGKRKSLTLSRTQSPETVQVIRVDVVCNNYTTNSIISDNEDQKHSKYEKVEREVGERIRPPESKEGVSKHCYYANKYLLTNSYKKLEQNVPGGTKVTLHCKTFKLFDRAKLKQKQCT